MKHVSLKWEYDYTNLKELLVLRKLLNKMDIRLIIPLVVSTLLFGCKGESKLSVLSMQYTKEE
ncbi:hypothetical protein [Tenacibaculum ovolyticum]|uniref:hypothetical protein n=1 Tax=Tenacibaculum ovolyticum TaxID=104270 RepID=UPI001F465E60|nr:hypothetical protein [Tenacibaculum ovolyticum]